MIHIQIFIDISTSMNYVRFQWSDWQAILINHINLIGDRFKRLSESSKSNYLGVHTFSDADKSKSFPIWQENNPHPQITVEKYFKMQLENLQEFLLKTQPEGDSYLVDTVNKNFKIILERYCDNDNLNEEINQDACLCVIIYTDGQIADRISLIHTISDICRQLDSENQIKIVMIGIGINDTSPVTPRFYKRLADNVYNFKDKNGRACNIFSFYLLEEIEQKPNGIIDILQVL